MKQFEIRPAIYTMDTAEEFCKYFQVGKNDLIFVSEGTYERYLKGYTKDAAILHYRKYGSGEPTDLMVEGIYEEIKDLSYNRVIAIGGGTILDVAKLFALKEITPVTDLYDKKLPIEKAKELILVPTTCGTGSEVTNISILELTKKGTKMGLAVNELYADAAVLIPQLLENLPFSVFATSSIDALIHSIESFTSPKANEFTKMYSVKAMRMILKAYKEIAKKGKKAYTEYAGSLLLASTFAGIAFGNAGCAAVHAMSYPLGAKYHVPHGEANYAMFTGVYEAYMQLKPEGEIQKLNEILADQLQCDKADVYKELEALLGFLISHKHLSEYGMTKEDIEQFVDIVMTKQTRLMSNNYVELSEDVVKEIYEKLF